MTSGWGQESAVSADEARRGRLPPWRWQWGGSDLGGVAVEQSGVARGSAGPRLAGWALLEPQVLQDPLDHLRILDAGDDPHPSAAALALLDLDREHPLQALRPAHPCRRRRPTLLGSSPALARLIPGFIAAPRHDLPVCADRGPGKARMPGVQAPERKDYYGCNAGVIASARRAAA